MISTNSTRRSGFTLVELLVVVSLIIVLAALATGIAYSGAMGSQNVVSGADRASGWLLIAKQRAKRDGAPRGVRFYINTNNPLPELNGMVTEAQYIEQPEPWAPNLTNNSSGPRLVFVQMINPMTGQITSREVHFIGTVLELNEFDQRVRVGDQLIVPEWNKSYRINRVPVVSNVSLGNSVTGYSDHRSWRIYLASDDTLPAQRPWVNELDLGPADSTPPPLPAPQPTYSLGAVVMTNFAFRPAPRELLGEETLQLTGGTVIDWRGASPITTTGVTPDSTGTHFDVLFAPSGEVMYTTDGLLCLWVRDSLKLVNNNKFNHPRLDAALPAGAIDTQAQYDDSGQQILIVVYSRTGTIATQQVAPPTGPGNDPYRFAKDGINAGL